MSSALERLAGSPEPQPRAARPDSALSRLAGIGRITSSPEPEPAVVPRGGSTAARAEAYKNIARLAFRALGLAPSEPPVQEGVVAPEGLLADPTMLPAMVAPVGAGIRAGLAGRSLVQAARSGAALGASQGAAVGAGADIAEGRSPLPSLLPNTALGALAGGVLAPAAAALTRGRAPVVAAAALEPIPPRRLSRMAGIGPIGLEPPAPPRVAGPPSILPTRTRPATQATGGTVPQVFKTDKFGLADLPEAEQHVAKTLTALGMDSRRVRSFADMRKAAGELGLDPDALLKGAASRPISDAEVVATANLINRESRVLNEATKALDAPGLTFEERAALQGQANRSQRLIEEAIKRRVRGGTESGRSVAAFRIIGQRNLDPAYWYSQAQRQLGDEAKFTSEIRATIDGLIAKEDRLGLARFMAGLRQPSFVEKAVTLVRAGLLSNPGTDVRNVGGNLNFAALEHIKDIPAATFDRIISLASGQRAKLLPSRRVLAEEARGIRAGVKKAGEVLRHGDTEENLLARYDYNRDVRFDNAILDTYVQAVFRRLGAQDALFREPAARKALAEMAELTAKNQGLKGEAFLERVRDLILKPTDEMVGVARAASDYAVFGQQSNLASAMTRLTESSDVARVAGLVVAPFKRTPVNIAKAVVDYSPFGAPVSAFRYIRARGGSPLLRQRYFVEGLGRSVTGTTLAGLGYALARQGLAVGGRPSDEKEKTLRRAMNVPDYAIRQGDKWVAVGNNAPLSNILMMGVDAYESSQIQGKSGAQRVGIAAGKLAKGLTEQTFLKGVSAAREAVNDPDRFGGAFIEGIAGMLVPSLVGAIARGSDPSQRVIEGPAAAVAAKVPGLRQTLPEQVGVLGRARRQETGVAGQMFSPVRAQTETQGQAAQAMKLAGYAPPEPQRSLTVAGEKVKLTPEQYADYSREVGQAVEQAIERLSLASLKRIAAVDEERARKLVRNRAEEARERVTNQWKRKLKGGAR